MNEALFGHDLQESIGHEERLALGEAFEDNVAEGREIGTDDIVRAIELAE